MDQADEKRIKRLKALCDQLDLLRKLAEEICADATAEIHRAERATQRERRNKTKKVKRDRRN